MCGDFFTFAVKGYAEQQALVDVVVAGKKFFQGREQSFEFVYFRVEPDVSQIYSQNIKRFAFGQFAHELKNGSVAAERDYQVGLFKDFGAVFFFLLAEEFRQIRIPGNLKVFFLKEGSEFLKKIAVFIHARAAEKTNLLEFLEFFCFHRFSENTTQK